MKDKYLDILLGIQNELSTNTSETKELKSKVESLDAKVSYTNGKVRLHTKILLVVGAVLATLLLTSDNKEIIEIVKLFI